MNNTELVKFLDRVTQWRDVVTLNRQKTKSGKEQYIAFLGYDAQGKTVRRSLGLDKDKAYAEVANLNKLMAERNFKDAPNVFDLATSYEVKAALTKLEGHGATLVQAVDFFLEHHRPTKGHLTVEEGGALWIENLKRRGLSEAYIHQIEKVYIPHFNAVCGKKRLVDVTQDDAESFIYTTKESVSSYTKGEYIVKMRSFFKAMSDLGYYQKELNPFLKLKRPQASREEKAVTERDRCLPLDDVYCFLDYLSKNKIWDILAIHAAVMFCGVRMDEAQRLTWDDIFLDRRKIDLTKKAAKKHRRRVLDIPDNALAMLTAAKAGLDGEWIRGKNALKLKMKRIKKALRELKANDKAYAQNTFHFHTNFARVSFASYSYALHGAEKTKEAMGHLGNVNVLHTNYKEVATKDNAQMYFNVVPFGVKRVEKQEEPKIEVKSITGAEKKPAKASKRR